MHNSIVIFLAMLFSLLLAVAVFFGCKWYFLRPTSSHSRRHPAQRAFVRERRGRRKYFLFGARLPPGPSRREREQQKRDAEAQAGGAAAGDADNNSTVADAGSEIDRMLNGSPTPTAGRSSTAARSATTAATSSPSAAAPSSTGRAASSRVVHGPRGAGISFKVGHSRDKSSGGGAGAAAGPASPVVNTEAANASAMPAGEAANAALAASAPPAANAEPAAAVAPGAAAPAVTELAAARATERAAPATEPAAAPVTQPDAAPVTQPGAAPVAEPAAAGPTTEPAAAVTEPAAAVPAGNANAANAANGNGNLADNSGSDEAPVPHDFTYGPGYPIPARGAVASPAVGGAGGANANNANNAANFDANQTINVGGAFAEDDVFAASFGKSVNWAASPKGGSK
ncbi:hypothetical protein SLS54_007590 [Diplodia seriata]